MADIKLSFDDGSEHTYKDVPDSVTADQVQARAASEFTDKQLTAVARTKKATGPRDPKFSAKRPSRMAALGDLLESTGKGLTGLGDAGLAALSGAVAAPVAGVAGAVQALGKGVGAGAGALATGGSVGTALDDVAAEAGDTVRHLQDKMTYSPRSDQGKATAGVLAKPFEMASAGLGAAGGAAGALIGPKTEALGSTLGENAIDIAGSALGAGALTKGLRGARALKPELTQAQDAMSRAQANGYQANPMDSAGGIVNTAGATVADSRSLDSILIAKNAGNSTRLAKQALGVAEKDFLNDDSVAPIKAKAEQAYDALQELTDVDLTPDQGLLEALHGADKRNRHAAQAKLAAPEYYRTPEFERLKSEVLNPAAPHTVGSLMAQIADLRADAAKMFKRVGSKPAEWREAGAMQAVAGALEDFLARKVTREHYVGGDPVPVPGAPTVPAGPAIAAPTELARVGESRGPTGTHEVPPPAMKDGGLLGEVDNTGRGKLIADWQAARELLAKVHNVEAATNFETGHVDPAKLKAMRDAGGTLTGPLADIVQGHEAMGHVVRGVEGVTTNTGLRASDMSRGSLILHAVAEPLLLPLAARKVMATKWYQRYMAHPDVTTLQHLREIDPAMAAKAMAAMSASSMGGQASPLPPRIELNGMTQ